MLNIPEAVKQLFKNGESQNYSMSINVGTTKYFTTTLYTIPEENIKGESAELRETLFSGNNPKFGTIQTSQFTVSLLNFNLLLKGKYIRVFLHYGPALNIIPYGEFYVESVEKTPYSSETKLICYDYSYFLNVQAANKIRHIPTATANTAISMCEAIFDKLHLQYTPFTSSTTYNYVTKIPDNTTYGNMLEWMGELYGGWWKPDRYGVFRFVQIGSSTSPESIDTFRPKAGEHETSQIPDFTGIIFNSLLRLEETKEQDYLYGSDDGLVYTMDKSNPYIVNYTASQLNALGQTLLSIYNSIKYIPNKIKIDGRPYLECGDWYTYLTDDDTEDQIRITAPVIQSIISGIGALNQTLQAVGQSQTTGQLDGTEYNQSSERTAIKDTQTIVSTGAGGGGNKIYTSKSAPDTTVGSDGDLWVKYFVDYNDKLVNSHGDEVDVNLPRYESADDAYNYVDLTIRPQIRSMCNLASTEMNAFIKAFEGGLSIVAYLGSNPTHNITASQFSQLTADTYTINNQSFSISNGGNFLSWGDNPVYYRYIGTSESDLLPFGAIVNMDDFNENLFDGYEITVLYYYVYYNTSNKKFEYIYGSIKFENVNHTYWGDALWKKTSDISIDLLDTAYYTIDELYCKINDDWTLYESDDGSTVIVNQVLTSGTEIAQISVDGEAVSIYAPTSQNEVYYGTSLPTADIGQDSALYYKTIQRPEDLKTLNVVEYIRSASGTYIPTDILLTSTTRIIMQGTFYQGYYEGRTAFGTEGRDLSDDVGRFVAITSSTSDISNCRFYFGSGNGSCEGIYETDVMLIADTTTRTFTISGNGTSHSVTVSSGSLYTPSSTPIGILCTNTSSEAGGFSTYLDYRKMNPSAIIKHFQVYENNVLSYDLIPVQNANDVTDCGLYDRIHRKYYQGKNYNNYVPFTAGTPTGEVINQLDECVEAGYLRVNDEWWEIYNGGTEYFAGNYIEITENNVITSTLKAGTNIQIADDGTISASATDVTQIVTSGTEIATINGTSIYAPTVSATQTQTSGTEIGNITVGSTSTTLYAPTPQSVSVTQTLASGTEIGSVTIDNTTTTLYAPSGGGSDVTVTPITTTGTNIANIAVDGTTYNLFAPSGGGGGGHNYSTTEQVVGTWIDGSTIYEKTYSVQNNSATSGETEIALSDINDVTKVEGFTTDNAYNRVIPLAYRSNSDSYVSETICVFFNKFTKKLVVRWKGINFGTAYITIQYTKTS